MDRQTIIETNRSLRLIKNELESLLEKGVLSDAAFDSISSLLPAETPLSAAGRSTAATAATTTTTTNTTNTTRTPSAPTPTPLSANVAGATNNSSSSSSSPAPPSYAASTAPPSKPVLVHARALYRYAATDPRDLSFERDDRVAVHEYMNDDWWLGSNLRTGEEGIFPKNYVVVDPQGEKQPGPAASPAAPFPGYPQPQHAHAHAPGPYAGGPPPEGGEHKDSKMAEHGKKFGKKLGNAAIFGAGATIGSNIVNSIF
ncbi:hypothetical protein VTJ83DRAFT_1807 [Remersonia thermophila]|uniref:SH3 domain-containing protein n=1 Tax=Remersonia thermophila TaxID=72144 RepID=A0ABR4DGX8_9PEZI